MSESRKEIKRVRRSTGWSTGPVDRDQPRAEAFQSVDRAVDRSLPRSVGRSTGPCLCTSHTPVDWAVKWPCHRSIGLCPGLLQCRSAPFNFQFLYHLPLSSYPFSLHAMHALMESQMNASILAAGKRQGSGVCVFLVMVIELFLLKYNSTQRNNTYV